MMSHENIFKRTQELISDLKDVISTSPFSTNYNDVLIAISKSLNEPCKLAITGRVKSGKSSLVNVLLGKDYAVVGTSETTATINIFRYGKPLCEEKPILCEYIDGTSEWISKDNLGKLQGISDQILKQISKIKQLTYYIDDQRFKDTILIDTPGIDAVVGDGGDAHQEQTEFFLGLRKRHEQETITISNNADAVVLLLGDVAHESDIDFIQGFLSNRGSISCLNTIAVLSQIDLTDERVNNRYQIAQERYEQLSDYVNSVIPISAGLKRYLPSIEQATFMKTILGKVPSKDALNMFLLRSARMYFSAKIPEITLTLDERKAIYPANVPFRCFAVISKILYEYDVQEAIKILNDIAGIDLLAETLNIQFFGRSKQIKAELAIKQILDIIWEVLNCVNSSKFDSIHSEVELNILKKEIIGIQLELEKLSQITSNINKYFQAMLTLIENRKFFTADEYSELKRLFGGEITQIDDKRLERLEYWYGEMNNSTIELRRSISNLAYHKYQDLIT